MARIYAIIYFYLTILLANRDLASSSGMEFDIKNQCVVDVGANYLKKCGFVSYCEPLELTLNDLRNPSILKISIKGRLANRMFGYAILLALKRVYGYRTFMDIHNVEDVNNYFPRAVEIPSIENNLCLSFEDWEPFYNKATDLQNLSYTHGKVIDFLPNVRLLDNAVNGIFDWKDLLEKVEDELRNTFIFKEKIRDVTQDILRSVAENYRLNYLLSQKQKNKRPKKNKKISITFVGIHVRKRDADRDIVKRYNLPSLQASYYLEAIDAYREIYKHVVFIIVSDEMQWVNDRIMPRRGSSFLYPVGTGSVNSRTSIAVDLSLMASCNHTILSYGTFSFWAGFLSGGNRVIPSMIFFRKGRHPLNHTVPAFRLTDYGLM